MLEKEQSMRQLTKRAIADSFCALLKERSIDKITVKDIVTECGINRQTFYYHFCDIYDLMEWLLYDDIKLYISNYPIADGDWQAAIKVIFQFFYANRTIVLHAYSPANRAQYEQFIIKRISPVVKERIDCYPQSKNVPEEKLEFIQKVYTWACTDLIFEWLEEGMPDENAVRLDDYFTIMNGSLGAALDSFIK